MSERFWRTGDLIYIGVPMGDATELTEEQYNELMRNKAMQEARAQRDTLLKEVVDSVNPMRWEALSDEQKNAWRAYRQALLDVPQQESFPNNIVWPEVPVEITLGD